MAERGRPTKYDQKYCDEIINWFDRPHVDENGKPCKLPLKTDWALEKGIARQTLYQWINDYPDFSDAIKTCEDIVKSILINNSLNGTYNPTSFIFTAKNLTDMRDQSAVQLQGDKDNPLQLEATMNIIHQRFPIQQIGE